MQGGFRKEYLYAALGFLVTILFWLTASRGALWPAWQDTLESTNDWKENYRAGSKWTEKFPYIGRISTPKDSNHATLPKGLAQTGTHIGLEKPESAYVPSDCPLVWNTFGLDVDSYEGNGENAMPFGNRAAASTIKRAVPIFNETSIHLDRDKFLLPYVTGGPNNQLIGFWEGVFYAISLNRTLVLPPFYKHPTDRQLKQRGGERVHPTHRIDVGRFCKFIPCIALEEFQKTCNYKVDAVMNKRIDLGRLRTVQSTIRMRIIPENSDPAPFLDRLMVPSGPHPGRFNAGQLKGLFSSSRRCAVYPMPFWELLTSDKRMPLYTFLNENNLRDENSSPDIKLFASIVRNTRQPKHIEDIVKEFMLKETGGAPYLSVHWRYNEGDYLSNANCRSLAEKTKICAAARSLTVKGFVDRIDKEIIGMKSKQVIIEHIYIAAPKSGTSKVAEVSQAIKSKGWKLISSDQLEQFFKETYSNCEFISRHFDDILSTTEMEICLEAAVFIGSPESTWTRNVQRIRTFIEDDTIDVSYKYMFTV